MRYCAFYLIVILLGLGGCLVDFPSDFIEFKKLPTNIQEEKFRAFPLEKQVDYYEYCWLAKGCDKFYFEVIACQGKTALPYLLERMEKSPDSKKYQISALLKKMHEEYVNIDDRNTTIKLVYILNNMEDPAWKEMTQKNLTSILNSKK